MNAPASTASLVKVRQLQKTYRRGSERMMTVVPSYPAAPAEEVEEPEFVATAEPVNSAPPPPPPPAPVEAA